MDNRKHEFNEFREWLVSEGYQGRYLGDIISRLRRAMKISDTDDPLTISIDFVVADLQKNGKPKKVGQHIKRSVLLYRKFSETS